MKKTQRWVVKAGSQMVCEGGALLLRSWMEQVLRLRQKENIEIIWVTSGAIAMAARRTNFNARKRTLPQKQALSALGQPMVMEYYNLALHATGQLGSQVLLTAGDIQDHKRRRNLQNTLEQLLTWKIIPIINENDAVATDEIRFGDNDSLSSLIAVMMGAERLILLTDVAGLYDRDPKKFPQARLISHLPHISARELKAIDQNSKSKVGTGGMYSKLLAAQRAQKNKIITHLVRGDIPQNLLTIAQGLPLGTQIGGNP